MNSITLNGKVLYFSTDWREILGPDVLNKKRTISSRLKELCINPYYFKKEVQDPEFIALSDRKLQIRIANSLRDKEEHRRRTLEANIRTFGTTSPMKVEEVRNKVISTNNKRYGHNSPASSEEIQHKIQRTSLERYGTTSPFKSEK